MEDKKLQHFGVLGMHWGVRRRSSSGSSGGGTRRFVPISSKDGRSVNKLFGKRNRTAVRNFLLGDAHKAIQNNGILKKRYDSYSKEDRKKMETKVSKTLATLSVISMAVIYKMIKG